MLQEEAGRLAKSIDYLPRRLGSDIVTAVLERLKEDASAMIADVWTRAPAMGGGAILELFASRSDDGRPQPGKIILGDQPVSLLSLVADRQKPIWLDNLKPGLADLPSSASPEEVTNRLSGDIIPTEYLRVYDRTRAFAAIPLRYREQLRGVLSLEAAVPGHIDQTHIDAMIALEEPLGILLWKCDAYEENLRQTEDAIKLFKNATSKLASPLNPYRTGFFARPFESGFADLERLVKATFANMGVRFRTYQHPPGSSLVVSEMLRQIHAAHFGVADITDLNANVLVELGVMLSARKPALIFKSKSDGSPVPFDVAPYQVYHYESSGEGIVVWDSTSISPIEKIIGRFQAETLMRDKSFTDAKELFPGSASSVS